MFQQVLDCARAENLLSEEHFSVDGTLIRAWASQASFIRKDGKDDSGDGSHFHGQKRSNDTHASTTDPDARLYKKSQGGEAHLAYLGHALTENRHGFAVAATLTHATGTAEREAALVSAGCCVICLPPIPSKQLRNYCLGICAYQKYWRKLSLESLGLVECQRAEFA